MKALHDTLGTTARKGRTLDTLNRLRRLLPDLRWELKDGDTSVDGTIWKADVRTGFTPRCRMTALWGADSRLWIQCWDSVAPSNAIDYECTGGDDRRLLSKLEGWLEDSFDALNVPEPVDHLDVCPRMHYNMLLENLAIYSAHWKVAKSGCDRIARHVESGLRANIYPIDFEKADTLIGTTFYLRNGAAHVREFQDLIGWRDAAARLCLVQAQLAI